MIVLNFLNNLLLNIIILASLIYITSSSNSLLYNTTSGIYEAKLVRVNSVDKNDRNFQYIHKIVGIPYAEKPERFKQSVLRKYENGVHLSKEHIICYQSVNITSYGLFSLNETPRMDEDCLTISLYIPTPSTNSSSLERFKNLSVVLHIHGGSNAVGSAALFDGSILASHDTTLKYPGNYALKDQILAIKWIRANCDVLNCNPDSITLWGHSAGACDVSLLALSPLSNKLFKRIIVQSGSSFAYWSYDKMAIERYKSLKTYFNCSNLPDYHTKENNAMTQLIENCLSKVPLDDLFSFKFGLIDSPGPTYDGFLGNESLINLESMSEMLTKNSGVSELDVMTGINTVEGFAFEGYFSSSVKFWTQNNLTNELIITFERFALLGRDKCKKDLVTANRLQIEQYYQNKIESLISNKENVNKEEVKRLKTIFANSHIIFDSGFVEFIKKLTDRVKETNKQNSYIKTGNLYVYEYFHENSASRLFLDSYKRYLNKNIKMSTHFDGIDLAFGLPLAYSLDQSINKKHSNSNLDYPFNNFILDSSFNQEDVELSKILMTYFANFIKNGDPNEKSLIYGSNRKWKSYFQDKSYMKISADLLNSSDQVSAIDNGIREDLHDFWFSNMTITENCSTIKNFDFRIENCIQKLEKSDEYKYLNEMFLIEYEKCMKIIENNVTLRNFFNTICLDVIIIRRLLIEYDLCCNSNDLNVTSTLCKLNNIDKKFINYNLSSLINYTTHMSSFDHSIYFNSSSTKSVAFCEKILFLSIFSIIMYITTDYLKILI